MMDRLNKRKDANGFLGITQKALIKTIGYQLHMSKAFLNGYSAKCRV